MERRSERPAGTVLVTGAGRGIGRATAEALAEDGHALVLLSKSPKPLADVHTICERSVPTRSMALDVSDEGQVASLRSLLAEMPPLHAVINNAGIGQWAPVETFPLESWDRQVATNLRGPFLITRETLPWFRRQGRGLYVNVASDCALVGMAQRAAYNASKFGLVGLTNSVRAELNGEGVHVCLVYAGKTDTYFRGHTPGDRPDALDPRDVAEAIRFVVGQYPRMVVGEISVLPHRGPGLFGPRSFV